MRAFRRARAGRRTGRLGLRRREHRLAVALHRLPRPSGILLQRDRGRLVLHACLLAALPAAHESRNGPIGEPSPVEWSGQLLAAAARLMVVFTQSVPQLLSGLGLDKYVELFADEEINDIALLTSMGPSMVRSR